MLDYYYIDLYFDPDSYTLGEVVESCVHALISSGCALRGVTMSHPDTSHTTSFGEHVQIGPADLPAVAEAFLEEGIQAGNRLVSFPPQGRIMFGYDFLFDDSVLDEVHEEEYDSHSSAEDLGLSFFCSNSSAGRKIKATLSFWEDYVLKGGNGEVHVENMRLIIGMIERIWVRTPPYFGSMNTELHIDTDSALAELEQGHLPEGSEFIMVGAPSMHLLSEIGLRDLHRSPLPDGGVLIQLTDKWSGLWAV